VITPIFLIEVARGQTVWRFTNYGVERVIDGELWTPENVEIGSVKTGFDFLAESVDLTFGTDRVDHPMRYYVGNPRAMEQTSISIFKVDAADVSIDRSNPYYVGVVGNNQPQAGGTITIRCSSLFRINEAPVPRPKMQRLCNHRFGDVNCTIDLATVTVAGAVTALQAADPPYVEAAIFGATATDKNDPNWLALGRVIIGSEQRMCVGQAGNRLYLDAPFNFASAGQQVSASAGCDKRIHTCLNKFNNLNNFLGFPYMPNQTSVEAALTLTAKVGGKK
jgi:uncharacterized phage protein (TIGR02218 family)